MIILGIDPGIALMGYGVLRVEGVQSFRLLDCGVVQTEAGVALPRRLRTIFDGVCYLIEKYAVDAVAVEELFFNKNVKTALTVAHARGAILTAAIKHLDAIYEYTPLQIKQAVVGYGRADKLQVQQMVKILLKLDRVPKPDDAADAVAVALCHAQTARMQEAFRIE